MRPAMTMVIWMKAFVRVDATSQVVELTEVLAPEPDGSEVLVAVESFGVGIHDRYFIPPAGPFPYVIGTEAAGVVVGLGPDAQGFKLGDRVMMSTSLQLKGGTWAEFAVVDQARLKMMPDALDFTTAAGIPVAGGTAVESIHALALEAGETLYVAGASGAIGTLVVQLAVQRGARVVGSASGANHDYLLSLGAELAVDYRNPEWGDEVKQWAPNGVDAALAIQPGTAGSSQGVVRDGGRVITVSGDPCDAERGIRMEQFVHQAAPAQDMADLVNNISDGRVRLVLEHVYAFDQALSALEKTETRHARGKLVVTGYQR